jgi:hypothetical protein
MSRASTVEYTVEPHGERRRVQYEPRADGTGHWRVVSRWNGCRWIVEGREAVTDVCVRCAEVVG